MADFEVVPLAGEPEVILSAVRVVEVLTKRRKGSAVLDAAILIYNEPGTAQPIIDVEVFVFNNRNIISIHVA